MHRPSRFSRWLVRVRLGSATGADPPGQVGRRGQYPGWAGCFGDEEPDLPVVLRLSHTCTLESWTLDVHLFLVFG